MNFKFVWFLPVFLISAFFVAVVIPAVAAVIPVAADVIPAATDEIPAAVDEISAASDREVALMPAMIFGMRAPDMVASAAPNAAPELTPIMCGSARGFLSTLCIWAPARASDAPEIMAVRVRGRRMSLITVGSAPTPVHRSSTAVSPASMARAQRANMTSLRMFISAKIANTFYVRRLCGMNWLKN